MLKIEIEVTETLSELSALFSALYTRFLNIDISQLKFRIPLVNSVLHECCDRFIWSSQQHPTSTKTLELKSTRFVGVSSFFASF